MATIESPATAWARSLGYAREEVNQLDLDLSRWSIHHLAEQLRHLRESLAQESDSCA